MDGQCDNRLRGTVTVGGIILPLATAELHCTNDPIADLIAADLEPGQSASVVCGGEPDGAGLGTLTVNDGPP